MSLEKLSDLTQGLFTEDHGPAGLHGDQWSEFAFLVNYLNASVIDANAVAGGSGDHNILELVSFLNDGDLYDLGSNVCPTSYTIVCYLAREVVSEQSTEVSSACLI